MRTIFYLLLVLLSGYAASTAHAQVHRCKEPGRLLYSDKPCDAWQTGEQIQRKRTQSEILQERYQAYEAELRKQDRRLAEQEREWDMQQRTPQPFPMPAVRQAGNDWQTRKDLENARTSAGSITNNGGKWDARNKPGRRIQDDEDIDLPQQSKEISRCSGSYCYDRDGQSYHNIGNGQIRSNDGTTCTMSGGKYRCR